MLVMTRENGEQLQLVMDNDEVIAITLTDIFGRQIPIGFEAPPACRVLRRELIEAVEV